jgi:dTDP-4-amino-4,6-dideoxygalactose transaminase
LKESIMSKLAIHGGTPVIPQPLPADNTIGADELAAVTRVFERGSLSGYYGNWGPQFLGGTEVQEFEQAWARHFRVPHAVSMNSATSGLFAAVGAAGISPGDEVIVPPTTMSATAVAPLIYGGIPVFADIDPDTFCLDVDAVRAAITPKTRAILAVNLFGHPAPLAALAELARDKGLFFIEDNAQGPLAAENGQFAGTVADIGVFSLNYHKHIHSGEGGVCVTRDAELALRLQAIRNHAENIVAPAGIRDPANMVGFNYRMSEMSAAVGSAQLRKIDAEVGRRQRLAERLTEGVRGLEGITPPKVRAGCRHVYYSWVLKLDERALGVSRADFSAALAAEGFPHGTGYVEPLYLLPMFQKRIAIGRGGWPFTLSERRYPRGLCPTAERLHVREILNYETCAYRLNDAQIDALIEAIRKVHAGRGQIAARAAG